LHQPMTQSKRIGELYNRKVVVNTAGAYLVRYWILLN